MMRQPSHLLVPASTAVPTAAAKQQNEKHNDEKRGDIHVRFPRNAAYCAAWNSGLLTTFSRSSGSRWRDGEVMTPAQDAHLRAWAQRTVHAIVPTSASSPAVRELSPIRRNARQWRAFAIRSSVSRLPICDLAGQICRSFLADVRKAPFVRDGGWRPGSDPTTWPGWQSRVVAFLLRGGLRVRVSQSRTRTVPQQ
jgi:hypothetical protein